jgi:cytochrome c biogenesis protein ResB
MMERMVPYLLVGLGGFLGANARYLTAKWVGNAVQARFPLGTFLINIGASFLLGFLGEVLAERLRRSWRRSTASACCSTVEHLVLRRPASVEQALQTRREEVFLVDPRHQTRTSRPGSGREASPPVSHNSRWGPADRVS